MDITRGKGNQLRNAIKDLETRLDSSVGPFLYLLIPLGILVIALVSRLYDLANFPYFTNGWPMCGDFSCTTGLPSNIVLPGLYHDEFMNFAGGSSSLETMISDTWGGPLVLLIVSLSTHILGSTIFAVRFPFAVASSVTTLMVYLTVNTMTNNRFSAILSSLYFIIMMPALVYGRMAFGENIIALLFILTFYSTLKIYKGQLVDINATRKWFIIASLCSILSIFVRLDGAVILLYFFLFLFRTRLLKRGIVDVSLILAPLLLAVLVIIQLFTSQSIVSFFAKVILYIETYVSQTGNSLDVPKFFLFNALPSSGAPLYWGISGYPIPNFWYIFLYLTLITMVVYSGASSTHYTLALAVATFFAFFMIFSEGFGDYWIVMIQPLLAVSFGPGIKRLVQQMPLVAALAFYGLLFIPLATSLGMTLYAPALLGYNNLTSNILFLWKLLMIVPLGSLLFLTAKVNVKGSKWRTVINLVLLSAFFAVLIIASFLVPDLYPYYI